jgi:L-seryl-tRNA(Ser) seleniumtransferase
VGTTNRTRIADYTSATTERTAVLLRVHRSNFTLAGFVEDAPLAEMAAAAHARGLVVVDDLGGGCLLDVRPLGLGGEPTVGESLAAGADLVLFSGDKLLGGPQAGLIVGRAALVERLRRHSLMRALRVDKMTLAALQATLLHYVKGEAFAAIPIWRMMSATPGHVRARAEGLAERVRREVALPAAQHRGAGAASIAITTEDALSAVGGGSLPGQTLPSVALAISRTGRGAGPWALRLAATLRAGRPSVVARVEGDRLLCDVRTILPDGDDILAQALIDGVRACQGPRPADDARTAGAAIRGADGQAQQARGSGAGKA